jgi:hypothetical protein
MPTEYRDVHDGRLAAGQFVQGADQGNGTHLTTFALHERNDQSIFAKSFQIAWDYLEATGKLGNPDRAAQHLLDTIEAMILRGERRQLLLVNKAIASYQSLRAKWGLSIAS